MSAAAATYVDPLAEARKEIAMLTGTLRRIHGHYELPQANSTEELCAVMSDWIYSLQRRHGTLKPQPSTQLPTPQPTPTPTTDPCPF